MKSLFPSYKLFFISAFIMALLVFILNICFGSVFIELSEILQILNGSNTSRESHELILFHFRIPKALTAIAVGAGLSVSGLIMQTMFRNPLAGPFILGISNGASLGVALLIMAQMALFSGSIALGTSSMIIASICGSALLMVLILLFSSYLRSNVMLLIVGMMLGSATGAIVNVLQHFSSAEALQNYTIWTFGSLAGLSYPQLMILSIIVAVSLIVTWLSQKTLNALLLNDEYILNLGINLRRLRLIIIIITCLMAGSITAFCGPIAFIGLAVPHVARIILHTANHKILIPASVLLGIIIMLLCDLISQLPGHEKTLPLNAITALFGAPIVIFIIIKGQKGRRL